MTKRNIGNLRSVVSYLNALENEIEIDILRYRALDIDPEKYGNIPRPTKWMSKFKQYRRILICISFLWKWIFGYLFVFLNYFIALSRVYRSKSNISLLNNNQLPTAVAFAERSGDVIESVLSETMKYNWITVSENKGEKITGDSFVVNLHSLLTVKDVNRVLYLSILSLNCYRRKLRPGWHIQLYTSFKWFSIYTALLKTNCDLITSEHFDRFAVLMDSVVQYKSRIRETNLTLIQHGSIGDRTDPNDILYNMELPTKLNFVTNLYVYDKTSEDFFTQNVFHKRHKNIDVSYFTPKLQLSDTPFSDYPKVLFVGHTICEELHIHIIKQIELKYNVKAYYKPHPIEKIKSKVINQQNWMIIEDRLFFPNVDLLISYPSTLTKEYEASGINSLIHPINMGAADSEHYLNLICEELNTVNTRINQKNIKL